MPSDLANSVLGIGKAGSTISRRNAPGWVGHRFGARLGFDFICTGQKVWTHVAVRYLYRRSLDPSSRDLFAGPRVKQFECTGKIQKIQPFEFADQWVPAIIAGMTLGGMLTFLQLGSGERYCTATDATTCLKSCSVDGLALPMKLAVI